MGAGWIWNEGRVGVELEQGVTYLSTTSGLGQPSYLVCSSAYWVWLRSSCCDLASRSFLKEATWPSRLRGGGERVTKEVTVVTKDVTVVTKEVTVVTKEAQW